MRSIRRHRIGWALRAAVVVLEYLVAFAVFFGGLWLICSLFSAAFRFLGVG